MLPHIVIVGRPNVWKSSLFNALTGHRIAIVADEENTTRDILEYTVHDESGTSYVIADSGGLNFGTQDEILQDARRRVEECASRADIIVFVVEYDKVTIVDEQIAQMLRKTNVPVLLVANKADNPQKKC